MTYLRHRKSLISILAVAVLVLLGLLGWTIRDEMLQAEATAAKPIALNELALLIKSSSIESLQVNGTRAIAKATDGSRFAFVKETGATVPELLAGFGVTAADMAEVHYTVADPVPPVNWPGLISTGVFVLILVAVALFTLKQMQRSNQQVMTFAKSKARLFKGAATPTTFADVAGVEEAKQELTEVVEFLKSPERFVSFGARIPKGVLLVGPPGTGKTLLARAVAGEADVPFFSISGSEFVEMYVGVGASRVRDLFSQAKRHAPCIIFIDEIDAVGRRRGSGSIGSHEEREQTLNQILVEMDGFDTETNVIVIAATNRADILDAALLRPGRFDRQVMVPAPDIKGRQAILEVHARGKRFDPAVQVATLAKATPGFSGADLANLVNEAAILAVRRNRELIAQGDLEEAIDRVIAGPERKSRVMSAREKELTAYHEAGHAVVGRYLTNHDPVHKITIIPRGMAGGYTRFLPPEDRSYLTRSQFEDMMASALGGHAAETIVFGEMSTGAGNDIEKATKIARKMVTEYGMSERLGPVALVHAQSANEGSAISGKIAEAIDEEVRRLIDEAYAKAITILTERRHVLESLAQELIRVESVEGETLDQFFITADAKVPVAAD